MRRVLGDEQQEARHHAGGGSEEHPGLKRSVAHRWAGPLSERSQVEPETDHKQNESEDEHRYSLWPGYGHSVTGARGLRMSERRRLLTRADALLLLWSIILGLAATAAFAVYRAVSASGEDTSGRFTEFGMNALWPGGLIFVAVAAVVWMGWKANLD